MGRNTTKYKKEIEPVWDEEKGWEKKLKQWVKRMSSFQQISHRNCRRYWEILSVSQELSINRQCCRRNTSEPGRWCYFFIIGATYDFFSNVLSSYFFLLFPATKNYYVEYFLIYVTAESESSSPLNTHKAIKPQAAMVRSQLSKDIYNCSITVID